MVLNDACHDRDEALETRHYENRLKGEIAICTATERCFSFVYENGFLISDNEIVSCYVCPQLASRTASEETWFCLFHAQTMTIHFAGEKLSFSIPRIAGWYVVIPTARRDKKNQNEKSISCEHMQCVPNTSKCGIYFDCRYLSSAIKTNQKISPSNNRCRYCVISLQFCVDADRIYAVVVVKNIGAHAIMPPSNTPLSALKQIFTFEFEHKHRVAIAQLL